MSELRQLKEKLKNCYLNGFFFDKTTFLKADEADFVMTARREDDGRMIEKPMIVLKNVVEMAVNHNGKVVAVENKPELAIWVDALKHAIERFNE